MNDRQQWIENDRQKWLDALKVGDEVAVNSVTMGIRISTVERITPTRRFVIEGIKATFGEDGIEMGDIRWKDIIQPATDSMKESLRRREMARYMRSFKLWDELDLVVLSTIYNFARAYEVTRK